MRKRIALNDFRRNQCSSPDSAEIITAKGFSVACKSVDGEDDRVREFIASTGGVDREGDVISPEGWDLRNYLKSGVFLWAHDRDLPPIATPLVCWLEGDKLILRVKFPDKDFPHPMGKGFGNAVMRMYDEGLLRGVSVGFSPLEWEFDEVRGDDGINFIRQELLEVSAVPVPANPEALHIARSKGIDTDKMATWLKSASGLIIPREYIDVDIYSDDDEVITDEVLDELDCEIKEQEEKEYADKETKRLSGGPSSSLSSAEPLTDDESEQYVEGDLSSAFPASGEPDPARISKALSPEEEYATVMKAAMLVEENLAQSVLKQCKLLTANTKLISEISTQKISEAINLLRAVLSIEHEEQEQESEEEEVEEEEADIIVDVVKIERVETESTPESAPAPEKDTQYVTKEILQDVVRDVVSRSLCKLTGRLPE